jgi:hypothetical protein
MAILVVCPGCRKRFQVSDQFAGKTGPCPNCKTEIKIPSLDEDVTIHGPESTVGAGRTTHAERSVKPIAFSETKWNPVAAAAVGVAVVVVVLVTVFAGRAGLFETSFIARAIGLVVITPPLVVAGYWFLRDSEDLDPYRGRVLYLRAAICSLIYVVLWGVFSTVAPQVLTGELWQWLFLAPPFLVVGCLAATFSLDLDFGNGFFHYCFYLLVTVLLQRVGGLGWVWEVTRQAAPGLG